jgi:alkylation response protein AidB-like acyl-CoA dehydrogenase
MERFEWWTEEQVKFAAEAEDFIERHLAQDVVAKFKRDFPWDIFEEIGQRKFAGAAIPKEYGGLGLGCTGACILSEAFGASPGINRVIGASMLGGLHQVLDHGTEEQKRKYLPRIANGELGSIVITEPVAGTDAAAQVMQARREGDVYILNGKKRFIVNAGVSQRYMVYARTSNDPEVVRKHRHLSAFIVEKGTKGFSVEKVYSIGGFFEVQNGVLDFEDVEVPVADRIGDEGDGWKVMTSGLNFERTVISAQALGWLTEILRNVVGYSQRRVQFGEPTINIETNQFKIARIIMKQRASRIFTYFTAHRWDQGEDITMDSNIIKIYNVEKGMENSVDAIQVMGGDGTTYFYPIQEMMQVAKVDSISGGSAEACSMVIFKTAMKQMQEAFKWRRRVTDPELGVPVSAYGNIEKIQNVDEEKLLKVLSDDYNVNPGIYMAKDDMKEVLDIDDKALDELLISMEQKELVWLYRSKAGIALAKASYKGLRQAYPKEHYQWFPPGNRPDFDKRKF